MGKIIDLTVEELTFTWFKFQVMLSEVFEHNMQALQMLFFCFEKENHVIQVDQAICQVQFT